MTKSLNLFLFCLLLTGSLASQIVILNRGCKNYNENGVCIECAMRYYKDQNNICQPVNPNCKTYDQANGDCLSCYPGFGLLEGACLPGVVTSSMDPNCNQFQNNICVKCSQGFYFGPNGKCLMADASCRTFNPNNGDCTSCYAGFEINGKQCIRSARPVTDPNCNQFDSEGVCEKCSLGYYFQNNLCTKIPDTCKTFNQMIMRCIQCYPGYELDQNDRCIAQQAEENPNPFCSKWNGNVCEQCAFGTLFNSYGICVQLDANCKDHDQLTGACVECYQGYELDMNGVCVRKSVQAVADANCNQFGQNGVCVKCSQGYYFNELSRCTKIPDTCKEFHIPSRTCLQCYPGYVLSSSNVCEKSEIEVSDVNCAEWEGNVCVRCSKGSYFNDQGRCITYDPQCKTFNQVNKRCLECYPGYALSSNNACVKSQVEVSDVNCAEWDQNICIKCSQGSYFNDQGRCVTYDPQCKVFNEMNRRCLQCYPGYILSQNNACQKSQVQVADVNCAEWDGNLCIRCSQGSYFNDQSICVLVDPQCKVFNEQNRRCLECYPGYALSANNVCLESQADISDVNCAEWEENVCVKCSQGSYFNDQGHCVTYDPQCKDFNQANRRCLECYPGYQLNQFNQCVKSQNQDVADGLCAKWNGQICEQCSKGSFFNRNGRCVQIDPSCATANQRTGQCLSCYSGYQIDPENRFRCIEKSAEQNPNPLCSKWRQNICISCAEGTFFNPRGICQIANPLCKTYNPTNGVCTSCYPGYQIRGITCVQSAQQNLDNFCRQFDGNICIICADRYFMNRNGRCQQVSVYCDQYNMNNGRCLSCYDGYALNQQGQCLEKEQSARDPLCAEWDGNMCVKCAFGSFMNSQGLCQAVDTLCETFDSMTGICTSCYPGHVLVEGKCVVDQDNSVSDPFCANFQNGICTKCSEGYYFQRDGKCTAVDPLCATYNPNNGNCLSCYTGYRLQGFLCIQSQTEQQDPNCAQFQNNICITCSQGFIFGADGLCQIVNPLCQTFNRYSGACLSCYTGYVLQNGQCLIEIQDTNQHPNCAEFIDGICIRCADRTFMNANGICEKVSDDCNTYDSFNGRCTSCYPGFALNSQSQCVPSTISSGCAEFNENGACIKCSVGFYSDNGNCIAIDSQCAQFDNARKVCVGCYDGYTLLRGKCEISSVEEDFEVENCFAYNHDNKCIQCYDRFYLNKNKCHEVDIFCKTYNETNGKCTSCYSTFTLENEQCLIK